MILRRVAQNLKQQHWTGVFIELVMVVLGVFIGLQVNNWNQNRQDHALEKQYLLRLKMDMQASISLANQNIKGMSWQHQLEGGMLQDLASCQLSPTEKKRFATGIYFVGRFDPPPLVRGTISELRSTGRLGLIRDVKLRKELANIWAFNNYYSGVLQMIVARATPDVVIVDQTRILHEPKDGWYVNPKHRIGGYVRKGSVTFDFPALCKDPRYAPAVSTLRETTRVLVAAQKGMRSEYQHILKTIDKDLHTSR